MGKVRGRDFDAVIGVGGKRPWAGQESIAYKVNWIGIGATKHPTDGDSPTVSFDHFVLFDEAGKALAELAPLLAERMYVKNARTIMDKLSRAERTEVAALLDIARDEPPSPIRAFGVGAVEANVCMPGLAEERCQCGQQH